MNALGNVGENVSAVGDEDWARSLGAADADEQAFAEWTRRHLPIVYRFLLRMVGSREDAEDLAQETFYAFHRHRSRLRPGVDPLPYLLTIARRKAISGLRWKKVRRIVSPLSPEHEVTIPSTTPSPAQESEQREMEREIHRALEALPANKRAAVILRFFEGLSYTQIAQAMDQPEGTVKSWVFRSERELRSKLSHLNDTGRR